jgi:hypothetical protein
MKKQDDSWYIQDAQRHSRSLAFVNIDLHEFDAVLIILRKLFDYWRNCATRTAPRRLKICERRQFTLDCQMLKGLIGGGINFFEGH